MYLDLFFLIIYLTTTLWFIISENRILKKLQEENAYLRDALKCSKIDFDYTYRQYKEDLYFLEDEPSSADVSFTRAEFNTLNTVLANIDADETYF